MASFVGRMRVLWVFAKIGSLDRWTSIEPRLIGAEIVFPPFAAGMFVPTGSVGVTLPLSPLPNTLK